MLVKDVSEVSEAIRIKDKNPEERKKKNWFVLYNWLQKIK